MAIVINGSGTVAGLAVGGLPDSTVDAGTLASGINKTSITDNGNATAITIDSSENVGIGVVPKAWRSVQTALDFGTYGGIASHSSGYTELSHNYYDDGADKYKNTDEAARILMQNNGTIAVQQAVSGSANAAVSWNTNLVFEVDGRGKSQFTAKAWASWNGTGTLAIRDSHNVSSVSDYGTGWYAPTYANAMANVNYGVYACGSYNNANRNRSVSGRVQNAGSCEVFSQAASTATDNADCYVLIFGD